MTSEQSTTPQAQGDLTALLATLEPGDGSASDVLFPAVYGELRAMAQSMLQDERTGHTLQATALVHEAYVKLVGQPDAHWKNRGHFFAVAAQAMRRILVDHARRRHRLKRGAAADRPLLLSDVCPVTLARDIDLLVLDEAMLRLAADDPMDARIVEMRFFAGLQVQEIAQVLAVSERTVQRHWDYAKAWLYRALTCDRPPNARDHA